MATGRVKWFNATKGYGFICPDEGGSDIFLHITALQQANIADLPDGQRVSYDLGDNKNGKVSAVDLVLLEGDE